MSSFASFSDSGSDFTTSDRVEMLKDRASTVISEKDAEIARLNREINEAEKLFEQGLQANVDEEAELKNEIARLEMELKTMDLRAEREIQALREQQADEIRAIMAKHQKEMETLHREIAERNENEAVFQRRGPNTHQVSSTTQETSTSRGSSTQDASGTSSYKQKEVSLSQASGTRLSSEVSRGSMMESTSVTSEPKSTTQAVVSDASRVSMNGETKASDSVTLATGSVGDYKPRELPRVVLAPDSSEMSSTELHVMSAKQKARDTAKEVEKLEAELRRATLFRQQQIAEQAQKMREEEERQRNERRERQKVLAETELAHKKAEYDQHLNDLREELQRESDALKAKIQKLADRNDELDRDIAETLVENDEKEYQLERVRQAKHNSTLTYTSTGTSSIQKKESPKLSKKQIRKASMFPEFSILDTEILRLRDENDELRRIIKRLDKLAYVRSPR